MQGEDLYVAAVGGSRWQGARASSSVGPDVGPRMRIKNKLMVIVLAVMLLSGAGAMASWAATTAQLTNNATEFDVANFYLQDSTTNGQNASTLQTFTGGTNLAGGGSVNMIPSTVDVYYIGVWYQSTPPSSATMTLTLADSHGGGDSGDAQMDIKIEAGTCSTAGAASMPAANASTATAIADCSGSGTFTPLTNGGTPVANGTFAANNGTTGNLDSCSSIPATGACTSGNSTTTWTSGTLGEVVAYQITVQMDASALGGGWEDEALTWTAAR